MNLQDALSQYAIQTLGSIEMLLVLGLVGLVVILVVWQVVRG